MYSDAGAIPLVLGSAISAASKFLDRGAVREGSRSTGAGSPAARRHLIPSTPAGRQTSAPALLARDTKSDQIRSMT